MPELLGKKSEKPRNYTVYASFMGASLVTNDGWKLRHYFPEIIFQLYYLPDDYREENNVIANYPEKLSELKEQLLKECNGDLRNGYFNPKEKLLPVLNLK